MLKINREIIKKLRFLLDEVCYGIIQNRYYDIIQYTGDESFIRTITLKPKIILELFFENKKVSIKKTRKVIGESIIEDLLKLNLISVIGEKYLKSNYNIRAVNNYYFIFKLDETVYLGDDSLLLSKYLPYNIMGKEILDLCTGSGIQAIMMSKNAKKVTGVEISKEAANAAKFNVVLNGLENKVKIKQGNCYEPIKNKKYDLIVSNPPFIPTPDNLPFPIAGRGGEDGLLVLRDIFNNIAKHLKKDGTGLILGITFGNNRSPFVKDFLAKIHKRDKLDTSIIVLNRLHKIFEFRDRADYLKRKLTVDPLKAYKEWQRLYRQASATYLYTYIVKIQKKIGKFKLINLYYRNTSHRKIRLSEETSLKKLYINFYAYAMNGQYKNAILTYKYIVKISNALGIKYHNGLYIPLSICYSKVNEKRKAIEKLKQITDTWPDKYQLHCLLSNYYNMLGEVNRSKKEMKKALNYIKIKVSKKRSKKAIELSKN